MLEVLIIVVLALVIFGAGKVKSAGSDLGAAVKDFRKALRGPETPPPTDQLPDARFPEEQVPPARGSDKPRA